MNSIGTHILSEQNTDLSINSIAAQREIYSSGKNLFYIQLIIAIPIPISLSLIQPLLGTAGENIAWIFALYGILAAFGEIIFENVVSNFKKKAAAIQEQFDCNVLFIDWNDTLISDKPRLEDIYKYSKKYKNKTNISDLYNWYSVEVGRIDTNLATVICQRTNCSYDFSLRKKFNLAVIISTAVTFILILCISASYGLTLPSFILSVLLPSVPVFTLAFKQITNNQESIKNLSNLQTQIEEKLNNAKLNSQINDKEIRQIQDKIYCNRTLSPLLPDKLYKKLRKGLEEQMNFSAEEKINQLEQN